MFGLTCQVKKGTFFPQAYY